MWLVHLRQARNVLFLSAAALSLLLIGQFFTPASQARILTNAAMVRAAKTLLAPGSIDEGQVDAALTQLLAAMDTGADPYVTLRRLRNLEASRWYLQSQWLKENGKEWETVFSYQEWTRRQFDRTILDLWKATDSPNWYGLGKAAGRIGLWPLAAYFYRHALTNDDSGNSQLNMNYAEALIRSGKQREADTLLNAAKFTNPLEQAKINWLLAQSRVAQSQYSDAVEPFQEVVSQAPALLNTAVGADIARQIEANVPMGIPTDMRSAWSVQASNLLVNGGFEKGIKGWGMWPEPGANNIIDDDRAYTGSKSFRVQFDGSHDVNYYQVSQKVQVQPGQKYQLSAEMWVDGLAGDVALEVRAQDWFGGVTSPVMHGSSQGWQEVTHSFVTPENVNEVTVTIVRYGGNGLVSGTVWVDDIVMLPVSAK